MADEGSLSSWKAAGFACVAALALGGCGAVRGAAELTDLATKPGEPKPFVTETRPQDPKYIAIGTTVSREARRKTVSEFKALEADLDARRVSNEAAGTQAKELGSTPPPAPATLPKD